MAKSSKRHEPAREDRITMEVVVDAYGQEEQAMGWYYYLRNKMQFPFKATCTVKRAISPLRAKDVATVTGMAPEDECQHEMFVMVSFDDDDLAVPLSQLKPARGTDEETCEAVADWHYWVKMGYQFG
jgi:hypothetical protein